MMETVSDVSRLLAEGQGEKSHWFPCDFNPSRLAAVLVGMANGNGGTVLIGLSPRSGHVQGVVDIETARDLVFQASLMSDPVLVLPLPQVIALDQLQLLSVFVPPGLPHVYSLEGRYLGREGTQTNPLPARHLRHLIIERGVVQFESLAPADIGYDDLDFPKIADYIRIAGLSETDNPKELLIRRGCLRDDSCPTYASLLLFGRTPQRWLPNATILAARFSGPTFADHYIKEDINGTLPDQLRRAETFVRDHLRSRINMEGLAHQEVAEYPLEAVREILVNAVAHRDYNLQGDNIHLFIFSDRIEIQSPGGLPGPVNLQNLLEARFSRNAVIVQVLSDLGFVERLGYGLDRVVHTMRKRGLRAPQFEEIGGGFRVTLYAAPLLELRHPQSHEQVYQHIGLNPRQEAALSYLAVHRRITNREYQDLCPEVHPETLRRDLSDLVSRGVLIKIGDKKSTYYILKR